MGKVLVIQGAGMNMRGKVQLETFGPMTLGEMNEQIVGYGKELDMDIELFHSNVEGEVINALYEAHDSGYEAGIINPAGYTTTTGPIKAAIAQVQFPMFYVHASNPTSRGTVSQIQPVCKGSVYGFGVYVYPLALAALTNIR